MARPVMPTIRRPARIGWGEAPSCGKNASRPLTSLDMVLCHHTTQTTPPPPQTPSEDRNEISAQKKSLT